MESLENSREQVLGDFVRIAAEQSLAPVLIGAGARVMACLGTDLDPGRRTTDWDLAVPVEDWEAFAKFVQALTQGEEAPFRSTDLEHRLVHDATDVPIDLIPFAGVEESPGRITWPKSGREMNVSGIDLVLEDSEHNELSTAPVRHASLLSQAMQKPAAYMDRRGNGITHDVIDFLWLVKKYGEAGNEERVFDEAFDTIDSHDIDPFAYGAALLGQDLRKYSAELLAPVRSVLVELCAQESQACRVVVNWRSPDGGARSFADIRSLASVALIGLNSPTPKS